MKIQVVRYGNTYMLKVIAGPLAMRVEGEYSSPEAAIRSAQEKCPGCEVEDVSDSAELYPSTEPPPGA